MPTSPAASMASLISRAPAASTARGFSQNTCLPASISRSVVGWCTASGVILATASKPPQASASSVSAKPRSMPYFRWNAASAAGSISAAATTSQSSSAPNASAWLPAMKPVPRINSRTIVFPPPLSAPRSAMIVQRKPSSPSLCKRGPFSTNRSRLSPAGRTGASETSRHGGAGLWAQRTALRRTCRTCGLW